MKHLTAYHMIGFRSQLQKEAGVSQFVRDIAAKAASKSGTVSRALTGAGHVLTTRGFGSRMVLGGGIGAGIGAATGEEGDRLRSALKGGAIGAGVGGGAYLASKPGREATKRFLKRQRYYVTGKGADNLDEARKLGIVSEAKRPVAVGPLPKRQGKRFAKAQKMQAAQEDAFNKGYLSLPGMTHGLLSRDAGNVVRSGWNRQGGFGKAFMGLGAMETGRAAMTPSEPGGPGRAARTLTAAGQTAGWLVAPHAMLPGMAAAAGLGTVGKSVGRGIDAGARKLKPHVPTAPLEDY